MRITIDRHMLCDLILACDALYDEGVGAKWMAYGRELRQQLNRYDKEREERRNAENKR